MQLCVIRKLGSRHDSAPEAMTATDATSDSRSVQQNASGGLITLSRIPYERSCSQL